MWNIFLRVLLQETWQPPGALSKTLFRVLVLGSSHSAPHARDAGKQAAASAQKERQCQAKKLRQNPEHTLGQSNEEERDCSLEVMMRPRPTEALWIPSWHQD